MDSHVFYFHEEKQVVRSYIGSHFLGDANAEDTFQSIQAGHGKLDLTHNVVQVSMDGANVNWKTVEITKKYREHNDPDSPDGSSRPEVFCKKGVHKNFRKIHRKTPVPESLFLIKLQA